MNKTINEITYTNLSYYSVQHLPQPSIPHQISSGYPPSQPFVPDPYPYGSYPVNYAAVDAQPGNYSDPNAGSASWVVRQAAPVPYSPIVQPLSQEATASASHASLNSGFAALPEKYSGLVGQNLLGKQFKRKLKKSKVVPLQTNACQSVWCKLCNIECGNIQDYERHLSGKKHGKNVKKIHMLSSMPSGGLSSQSSNIASGTGTAGDQSITGVPSMPTDLEAKKQKLLEGGTAVQSVRICTICNVACNGEIVFAAHLVGKKHLTRERSLGIRTNSDTTSESYTVKASQVEKSKDPFIAGLASCEICKISCTDVEGLVIHRQGKKHKKNLEKLKSSIPNMSTPAPTAVPTVSVNPPTVTVDSGEAIKAIGPEPEPVNCKKARLAEQVDLETKKRKVMECGAAAEAVRACTVCNVVCNSEAVFIFHLAGQKHAAMVKKAEARVATDHQPVVAAT